MISGCVFAARVELLADRIVPTLRDFTESSQPTRFKPRHHRMDVEPAAAVIAKNAFILINGNKKIFQMSVELYTSWELLHKAKLHTSGELIIVMHEYM